MAQEAGQTNDDKRKPYFGERTIKTGNIRQDQRKLREMLRAKRPRRPEGNK